MPEMTATGKKTTEAVEDIRPFLHGILGTFSSGWAWQRVCGGGGAGGGAWGQDEYLLA